VIAAEDRQDEATQLYLNPLFGVSVASKPLVPLTPLRGNFCQTNSRYLSTIATARLVRRITDRRCVRRET